LNVTSFSLISIFVFGGLGRVLSFSLMLTHRSGAIQRREQPFMVQRTPEVIAEIG
jgi:hypothetical protein